MASTRCGIAIVCTFAGLRSDQRCQNAVGLLRDKTVISVNTAIAINVWRNICVIVPELHIVPCHPSCRHPLVVLQSALF